MPQLRKLELRRIDIPAADIDKLKSMLPSVAIAWIPLTDEERTKLNALLKK